MKKIYLKPALLSETVIIERIMDLSKVDDPAQPGGGLVKDRDEFPNDEDRAIIQLLADQEQGNVYDLW